MPTLREIVDLLHGWYPPETADSWDAVGLVYGDPAAPVRQVMFAVDPTLEVAREAAEWGADLLVVHHPLFLKPVHGFAATTPKGRTLATLAGAGCALLTAHTNADQADEGVSEALALALGLRDLAPIVPASSEPRDKLVVFAPEDAAVVIRVAIAEAGPQLSQPALNGRDGIGTLRLEGHVLCGRRPWVGVDPHHQAVLVLGHHAVLAGERNDVDVVDGQTALLEDGPNGQRGESAEVLDAVQALLGDAGKHSGRIAHSGRSVVPEVEAQRDTSLAHAFFLLVGNRIDEWTPRPIDAPLSIVL